MERIQSERTTASASPSPSVSSTTASPPLPDVYNGVLDADQNGFIFCRPVSYFHSSICPTDHKQDDSAAASQIDVTTVPTPDMLQAARNASVDTAIMYIRNTYVQRLAKLPGLRPIHLFNAVDATTPSLRFRYIPGYVLDEAQGVYRASLETQEGCDQCSWNMGRSIGCEYTKKCSCLEYAPVDEARISDPEMRRAYKALQPGDSTAGFPKKFPYFAVGTKREKEGCLVPFYRNTRWPIFECNDNCNCGSDCRNKNVQFGRKVELEIFRTKGGRGWGLRCREDLHEGQFIDTYRGEVITDAEATRRENTSSKSKASYLFTLDKFAESEGIQDPYVVDGEFMGGPTIFMNHSCDPNCRMYVVSYNKNDPRVYDLAFFAHRDIPAGEELTFHYLDSDDVEAVEEPGEGTVPCLCGTAKCRKWLWT